MIGIYSITTPNGKVYIGQSWNIERRWKQYKNPNKKQILLHRSLTSYGFDAHEFKIIHELPIDIDQETLSTYEIFYISLYRDSGITLLNLTDGGQGGKMSEASRLKMSQSLKGRTTWNKGLSSPLKGKILTLDTRHNMSVSKLGKPSPNKGRKFGPRTEQQKLDHSLRMKGRALSFSHRENLKAAWALRKLKTL